MISFRSIFSFVASLLLVLLFSSCDEEKVRFDEPQPEGVESDTELRKGLQGNYFCTQDSTWLHVGTFKVMVSNRDPNSVYQSDEENLNHKTEVGITHGKDSSIKMHLKVGIDSEIDSLQVDADFEETLIDIKQGNEARFYKGYYFLNKRVEEGSGYRVRILRPTKEGLLLCRIQTDSILHLLENEDFVKKETNSEKEDGVESWTLHPSRKELKKLLKMGLFSDVKLYKVMSDK